MDKYIYGEVLGKSGKEPHMVFSQSTKDMYLGGSAIIANHLSDFIKSVSLISDIGKEVEIKQLLKQKLKKNIKHISILPYNRYKSCVKTRFIDSITRYKLLGSYIISNLEIQIFINP